MKNQRTASQGSAQRRLERAMMARDTAGVRLALFFLQDNVRGCYCNPEFTGNSIEERQRLTGRLISQRDRFHQRAIRAHRTLKTQQAVTA